MHRLTPKLIIAFKEGYGRREFAGDVVAGLTVAIIALPLAMALGIASIPREVADPLAAQTGVRDRAGGSGCEVWGGEHA